jgi:DNA-binding transcriptional MocR family regulator
MFSRSGNFGDAFRLNYSYAWTPEIEGAVVTLGKLASRYAALERKEEGEERDLAIR